MCYLSTGHLPPAEEIVRLVDDVYARYQSNTDGKNSQVYRARLRC
jgi:glutaminase